MFEKTSPVKPMITPRISGAGPSTDHFPKPSPRGSPTNSHARERERAIEQKYAPVYTSYQTFTPNKGHNIQPTSPQTAPPPSLQQTPTGIYVQSLTPRGKNVLLDDMYHVESLF